MKRTVIFVLLIIALLGCACAFYWQRAQVKTNGDLILSGNVDIRQVDLGSRVSGKLDKLNVDEGDRVKTGEIIAALDKEPYEDDMAAARAAVAQGEAGLNEQQALLDNAVILFNRQKELVASGSISKQNLDDALAQKKQTEAREKNAEATLAQAQAKLAKATTNLKDTDLVAPEDGIILTRAREKGAILAAGTTVFTVSLDNPVWIRAYVSESDLGHIKQGMQANITTDAHPDKPLRGQIGFISPTAEFTPKNVETPELRTDLVYRLRIVAQDPKGDLRQGMPVTLKIDTSVE